MFVLTYIMVVVRALSQPQKLWSAHLGFAKANEDIYLGWRVSGSLPRGSGTVHQAWELFYRPESFLALEFEHSEGSKSGKMLLIPCAMRHAKGNSFVFAWIFCPISGSELGATASKYPST